MRREFEFQKYCYHDNEYCDKSPDGSGESSICLESEVLPGSSGFVVHWVESSLWRSWFFSPTSIYHTAPEIFNHFTGGGIWAFSFFKIEMKRSSKFPPEFIRSALKARKNEAQGVSPGATILCQLSMPALQGRHPCRSPPSRVTFLRSLSGRVMGREVVTIYPGAYAPGFARLALQAITDDLTNPFG